MVNPDYPTDAVRKGVCLIMTQNIFTFGNLTFKQLNGPAIGTPPTAPYATIYHGIQRNMSQDITNALCSINNSLMMSSESGSQIQIRNMM